MEQSIQLLKSEEHRINKLLYTLEKSLEYTISETEDQIRWNKERLKDIQDSLSILKNKAS